MKNKEYGSDFYHYDTGNDQNVTQCSSVFPVDTLFCFSGRVALRSILLDAIERFGVDICYVPSYYCHEVYSYVEDLPINFYFYNIDPFSSDLDLTFEDLANIAILRVDYFGLNNLVQVSSKNNIIIDDFTHNFDAIKDTNAHYKFGSLRKILPVPVGGFIFSDFNIKLPFITHEANQIAEMKELGMFKKLEYLKFDKGEKSDFREILLNAESRFEEKETFSLLPYSVLNKLNNINVRKIIDVKKKNSKFIKSQINKSDYFDVISNVKNSEFALILKFKNSTFKNHLRKYLIQNSIYPMVLWPDQKNNSDIDLSNLLLFIHIDYRYNFEDLSLIADHLNSFNFHV